MGVCLAVMAIILIANLCWWLAMKATSRLLEMARDIIKQEHIHKLQDLREEQQRIQRAVLAAARAREASRRKFVTPSGQTVVLDIMGQSSLKSNCLEELHLSPDANWPTIKKAWRCQALLYHPDRGGNPSIWLRKLRAYEALEQMHQQ